MADFSMWGPEKQGSRIAEQDVERASLNAIKARQGLAELAMMPDKAAQMRAQTGMFQAHERLYGAQAGEAERKEREATHLADETRRRAPELEGLDPGAQIRKLAEITAGAGRPNEAGVLLKKYSEMENQFSQAVQHNATARKTEIETTQRELGHLEGVVRGSKSQKEWDDNNRLYELMTGRRSPMAGRPFSDKAQLSQSMLSAQDVLAAELKRIEESGRAAGRNITYRHNRATERVADANLEIARTREARLEKEGIERAERVTRADRSSARRTSPDDRGEAARLLSKEQPDVLGDDRRLAVDAIASRANEIIRERKGMGRNQAMQIAYKEALDAGDFEKTSLNEFSLGGNTFKIGEKTRFAGGGKSAETAIPLPKSGKAADLKVDRFYEDGGVIKKWTATGWAQ